MSMGDQVTSRLTAARLRPAFLTAMIAGSLGVFSSPAVASPIILPSDHDSAHAAKSVVFVPPDHAQVCIAQFGDGTRTGHSYPIQLGGPSRRVSWQTGRRTRGRWAVYISCGTSKANPTSLGTARREFTTGPSKRGLITIRPRSFHATKGWIPAHPPKTKIRHTHGAHASDLDEIETGYAHPCSGPSRLYMIKAYAVGYGYGARIGFAPTGNASESAQVNVIWGDLQSCVNWPYLTSTETDAIYKQMVCHIVWGIFPGAGSSWDFEAWRSDPSWATALDPLNKCQQWGNAPGAGNEFVGHIVQGSQDTGAQKEAWLIDNLDGLTIRRHILTSKAFYCLKAQGNKGPEVLASDFLRDELTVGPPIGDEACGGSTPPTTPSRTAPLPLGQYYVQYADGGVYWRSGPDWNMAAASPGNGFYPGSVIKPTCYQAGAANVPGSADGMWEQASIVSGPGSGSGWINEHFVADGQPINRPSPGVPPCASTPPALPPPAQTWSEQETPNHPVNTFTNYHNASGMGPAIASGQWVEISCKVYDPTIASVNPDGYWYRIASPPWNGAYYSPANTFMNGDPYGGPYTHNTDFAVPDC